MLYASGASFSGIEPVEHDINKNVRNSEKNALLNRILFSGSEFIDINFISTDFIV
jgi:hypothetical protein